MSVSEVCRAPAALLHLESTPTDTWSALIKIADNNKEEDHADQSSIWAMIQSQKTPTPNSTGPYVHPLMRRSASLMSESSLEMCTESLGSETGSCDFSDDDGSWLSSSFNDGEQVVEKHQKVQQQRVVGPEDDGNQLMSVSYHCSASRRSPAPRSFPPPLTSVSRSSSTGTCIQMRTCRQDGRLVVDAVPVASQNYLRACRHEGRLLLSFINSAASQPNTELLLNNEEEMVEPSKEINQSQKAAENEEEDEDEEEVEVLGRGAMVEVKLSSQPQHPGGARKVLRSSIVINKFVGGTPLTNQNRWAEPAQENHPSSTTVASRPPLSPQRRLTETTTAAAAGVAASSACTSSEVVGPHKSDNKLLFTSRRRNREEMLHHMRRGSELRRPLFFWEAGCMAT